MDTTKLLQRIDKLQLEIQSIQYKLNCKSASKNEVQLPELHMDAIVLIGAYLSIEDLMQVKLASKLFKKAANYLLYIKSKGDIRIVEKRIALASEEHPFKSNQFYQK